MKIDQQPLGIFSHDTDLLERKVIVDPSNPIGIDENGEMIPGHRYLPQQEAMSDR